MRKLSLLPFAAFAALLLPACAPSSGGPVNVTAADSQAVRDIAVKYSAAYSKHDTAALGAIVTDNYEDVEPTGEHIQSRAGFVATAAKDFAMMPAGAPAQTMTATTTYVHFITPTIASAAGTWQMSGALAPGQPARGSWMGMAEKKDSTWRMSSALGAPDMTQMMMPDTSKKA